MFSGGQDVRDIQWNAEAADGNRRRLSTGALASGSMETPKHKSPGLEDTTAKIVSSSQLIFPVGPKLVILLVLNIIVDINKCTCDSAANLEMSLILCSQLVRAP